MVMGIPGTAVCTFGALPHPTCTSQQQKAAAFSDSIFYSIFSLHMLQLGKANILH